MHIRLAKLRLIVATLNTFRAEDIDHLNHKTYNPCSSRRHRGIVVRHRDIKTGIREVILGMRAPAVASIHWPSIVEVGFSDEMPLLKICDPSEGGISCYGKEDENDERDSIHSDSTIFDSTI
jgi:hypothetical protein